MLLDVFCHFVSDNTNSPFTPLMCSSFLLSLVCKDRLRFFFEKSLHL